MERTWKSLYATLLTIGSFLRLTLFSRENTTEITKSSILINKVFSTWLLKLVYSTKGSSVVNI